jgi:DnaJ-class molecular chaperone
MPNVSGRGHGDLHVIARAAIPKKLTKDQKRLIEELAKTLPPDEATAEEMAGDDKPFFERVKDIFG